MSYSNNKEADSNDYRKAQKDFMVLIKKNGFPEAVKTTDTQNTV